MPAPTPRPPDDTTPPSRAAVDVMETLVRAAGRDPELIRERLGLDVWDRRSVEALVAKALTELEKTAR